VGKWWWNARGGRRCSFVVAVEANEREVGQRAGTNASHGARPRPHYITACIIPDLDAVKHVSQSVVSWATALAPSRPCFNHHSTLLYSPRMKASMAIHGQSRPLCLEACLTYTRHEDQSMSMRSTCQLFGGSPICLHMLAPKARPRRGLAAGIRRHITPQPSPFQQASPTTSLCCCCQVSPANTR
jgi:hypothetical protein